MHALHFIAYFPRMRLTIIPIFVIYYVFWASPSLSAKPYSPHEINLKDRDEYSKGLNTIKFSVEDRKINSFCPESQTSLSHELGLADLGDHLLKVVLRGTISRKVLSQINVM